MLELLESAIDDLSIACDAGELRRAVALRDRFDAELTATVDAFDAAGLWDVDGALSMRDWLRAHARLSSLDAHLLARRAVRLRDLPHVAAAFAGGLLSSSQVDAVLHPLTNKRRPAFAELEADLVGLFTAMAVRDIEGVMAEWVDAFDAAHDQPAADEPANSLHLSRSLGDRGELRGSFEPEFAALLEAALEIATTRDVPGELRLPSERRADALTDIARHYLGTHDRPRRRRHAPHITLVLTPEQLANGQAGRTLDGRLVPHAAIATWVCDSTIRRLVVADGEVLDHGRAVRTVPDKLFDAVAARDGGCRYPGCDRPTKWCDGHHVIPWEAGGATAVTNVALLRLSHESRPSHPRFAARETMRHASERARSRPGSAVSDAAVSDRLAA